MSEVYLTTENLKVGYGKKLVVDGVDLEVREGEIISIIGPNGSGKSTILKTIANQLKALGGSVYIENMALSEKSGNELAKEMAVLFTDSMIKEAMTCFDVVSLGRYPYTGLLGSLEEEDRRIIDEVMITTDIFELKEVDYSQISDGQRQRVLLARALCQKPRILILDEPTTFLDIKYKLQFLNLLLKQAKEKNISIIMSLHELDMARQISDRIICIKDNKVEKIGEPEEIFKEGFINKLFDIRTGTYDEINARALLRK